LDGFQSRRGKLVTAGRRFVAAQAAAIMLRKLNG
jgi:hypothetical protein